MVCTHRPLRSTRQRDRNRLVIQQKRGWPFFFFLIKEQRDILLQRVVYKKSCTAQSLKRSLASNEYSILYTTEG